MLKDELTKYVPYNEQEAKDKDLFIDFINNNDDILTRKNEEGHLTSSCWIINKNHDKVLMCYHNIYDSYSWLGGHNDGNPNCLEVALKELREESGLSRIKILSNKIFSIEVLPVKEHIKRGKTVKKHYHYNITYLFEADEFETLKVNADENKDLRWFKFDELKNNVKEKDMYNNVYAKLLKKIKEKCIR